MVALRYVYLLALAVWLGGMIALGLIAAPTIFDVLQTRDPAAGRAAAGAVFGGILGRFHLVSYGCGAAMMASLVIQAILSRPRASRIRILIVTAMLGISLYSGIVLTRQIEAVQRQIGGPVSALPESDERRVQFGRLHGLSTALMMFNIAGGLLLLSWEASERK